MSDKNSQPTKRKFWYTEINAGTMEQWTQWEKDTKAAYPVQYFIRENLCDAKHWLKDKFFHIRRYFKFLFRPAHPLIRKALPREWQDISSLITDVNFAMIAQFKKEADESCVDWDYTDESRKFKNWLDVTALWVTEGRPNMIEHMQKMYPPHPLPEKMKDWDYEQLYGSVDQIEKVISETDTNILKQMIDYREYFWT